MSILGYKLVSLSVRVIGSYLLNQITLLSFSCRKSGNGPIQAVERMYQYLSQLLTTTATPVPGALNNRCGIQTVSLSLKATGFKIDLVLAALLKYVLNYHKPSSIMTDFSLYKLYPCSPI